MVKLYKGGSLRDIEKYWHCGLVTLSYNIHDKPCPRVTFHSGAQWYLHLLLAYISAQVPI